LGEVHGELAFDGARVEFAGRTDAAIARDLLVACGVSGDAVDAEAAEVAARCFAAYAELCPPDLAPRVAPGLVAVLDRLAARPAEFRMSLVTGNFEPVARLKLERAGLAGYFPAGQGGFGSDAEAREELPAVARERAGGWSRSRTAVIGDTPRDIACARADGVRVVAVTTGPFGAEALAGADAVATDAAELEAALEALAAA